MVRSKRAEEVDRALSAHLEQGGGALFVSNTVRHHRRDGLEPRLDVVARSMHDTLKGSAWERRRDRLGFFGGIKAVEVTWGEANGWHPHAHSLWLLDRPASDGQVEDVAGWLLGRWGSVVEGHGFGSINAHGVDVRQVRNAGELGQYLNKVEGGWSAGMELARSDLKAGRRASLTPVALLRSFADTGDVGALSLWREYERATFGKRALRWSPGLKARFAVEEVDDVEAAASEGIDLALLRCLVPAEDWRPMVVAGTTGEFLREVEEVAAALLLIADVLGHEVEPIEVEGVQREQKAS